MCAGKEMNSLYCDVLLNLDDNIQVYSEEWIPGMVVIPLLDYQFKFNTAIAEIMYSY